MKNPRLWTAMVLLLFCFAAQAQISLSNKRISVENFNSIGGGGSASLPANWKMSAAGNPNVTWASLPNTATTQTASSGVPSIGGRYNWATSSGTDRAIGFLTDGSYVSANSITAYYRNNTGSSVNSITVAFNIERYVVNANTVTVAFSSSTDGTTFIPQTPGDISTADFAVGANTGTFTTPKTISKTTNIAITVPAGGDVYFRWVFTNTGSTAAQGLGLDDVAVFSGAATPDLTASLRDILQVDNGAQNQFNEGDVIRYQSVIKNIGTGAAANVQLQIPPPSNTTLVAGSIKTSTVAVDDKYGTSINTALTGTTVLVNDFGLPSPTAISSFGPTANPSATIAGVAGTTDAGGTLTVNANGTFSYAPPTGFSGNDQFKYITGNGNLPNNDALVTIAVAPDIAFTTTNVDPLCDGVSNGTITFNASGGVGALTYSINNGSTFQSSNIFTGLAGGTYQLVVKDATGYQKTGSATLTNPSAIIVSGTISNQVYNTTIATASFTKTGGTGAITWSATGLPAGVGINASTGDVTGTPIQTGNFNAVITATDSNGCTGTKNVSFTVAPGLSNDTYAAVGNTQLVADAHSTPSTPFSTSATNILGNDAADAALNVTPVIDVATTAGGRITIDATGKFTYSPAAGSTTPDSYTYTATSNGVTATATINFNVTNMIWYVNNSYGGANGSAIGTSHRPFTTVNAAASASAISQIIYVHTGSGNTTGAALLKSGQTLRGAGAALTIGALSIPAGTKPTLSGTITLANSVTVDGFDMNTGATTALTAAAATGVSVTIGSITTSGAVNAINLSGTTGTIAIIGGTLSGGAGAVVNINGSSVNLTYAGTITQATTGQRAVNINTATGGTIAFSGTINSTGSSTGINLGSNTGATINFSGALNLNTGSNTAFTATGGGIVNITGTNNTIATTTAVAVNIQNTTIGASSVKFKSVSSNGAANGIILISTGTIGSFQVTGDGVNWGSGGTIQNTTGADGATTGNGIYISSASNVSFNFMLLNGHQNNAIFGTAVRGFDLNKTRFTGNNGTSNSGLYDESVVHLVDLGGAVSIKNSYFSGGAYNTIVIENITGTNAVISSLVVDADTLTTMQGSTADVRGSALLVNLMDGSLTSATIQNNRVDYWWGNAIHVLSQGTASATVSILNNYCNNTNGALAAAGGIWVAGGTLNYTVAGNNIQNTNGTAISADRANFGTLMKGTIIGNTIGTSGIPNSGSGTGIAIFASHHGNATTTTTINNNTIRQINGSASGAVTVLMGDDVGFGDVGGGFFNVTIQGNNIQETGTTPNSAQHGILVTCGVTSSGSLGGDNGVGCFTIGGAGALANVITNFNTPSAATAQNRIRINQRFHTTARFPGYIGASNDNTAVGAYLLGRNTASNTANVNNIASGGTGFTNTPGGVPCAQ